MGKKTVLSHNNKYEQGEVVFCKIRGFSEWPAKVSVSFLINCFLFLIYLISSFIFYMQVLESSKKQIYVCFYGTKERNYVSTDHLFKFPLPKSVIRSNMRLSGYQQAMHEAIRDTRHRLIDLQNFIFTNVSGNESKRGKTTGRRYVRRSSNKTAIRSSVNEKSNNQIATGTKR